MSYICTNKILFHIRLIFLIYEKSFVTVTPDESSDNKALSVNYDAYSSADDQDEYIIVSRWRTETINLVTNNIW